MPSTSIRSPRPCAYSSKPRSCMAVAEQPAMSTRTDNNRPARKRYPFISFELVLDPAGIAGRNRHVDAMRGQTAVTDFDAVLARRHGDPGQRRRGAVRTAVDENFAPG